ncbi:MAG: PAS domain S-box protein [Chloroflexi bacterium]|nr:PAS domain S-box protein [Chloroflexota bacterium]
MHEDGPVHDVSESTPRGRPLPRAEERPFDVDEIFFSTTDHKGIIRSGNRVFTRVSGYTRQDMIGQPHNLIRHPDMPRSVFQLFWEELGVGRPIAAYVKNMARDGAYYWVMATVVAVPGGYLSVRIKPSTPYFDTARGVYAELLAIERQVEAGSPRRRHEAMTAARARLLEHLNQAGFADYDTFMRTALLAEVKQRETMGLRLEAGQPGSIRPSADRRLASILDTCSALASFLGTLVRRLDAYAALNATLAEKVRFILDLAEDVRLFSLNGLLAATRIGNGAAGLEAVASLMQTRFERSAPIFRALTDDVVASVDLLGSLFFPVAATRLQADALLAFVYELLEDRADERDLVGDLWALGDAVAGGIGGLGAALDGLDQRQRALARHTEHISGALREMRALGVSGRIEAARVTEAEGFITLFQAMDAHLTTARREIDELAKATSLTFAREAAATRLSRQHVETIRHQIAALARTGAAA